MKKVVLLAGGLVTAGCGATTGSAPMPQAPTQIIGCTRPVTMPACSEDRTRPYFPNGSSAEDLKEAYEKVKGQLLKSENCVDAISAAVEVHTRTCFDD